MLDYIRGKCHTSMITSAQEEPYLLVINIFVKLI